MCGNFSTAELAGVAETTPPTWVGDTPCLWQSLPGGRAGPEVHTRGVGASYSSLAGFAGHRVSMAIPCCFPGP